MLSDPTPPHDLPAEGMDNLRAQLSAIAQAFEQQQQAIATALEGVTQQARIDVDALSAPFTQAFARITQRIQADFEGLEASARALGAAGWTLPMWAPPALVPYLLDQTNSLEDLDTAFIQLYSEHRAKEFRGLFRSLERRVVLKPWMPLLIQCRYAYLRRKYVVTVPALLAVLEGLVAAADGSLQSARGPRAIASAKSKATRGIQLLLWASVDSFVDTVFGTHSFSASRPRVINRHWILHGRDAAHWTHADSLRLFQAIDTVSSTVRDLEPGRAA
jgi:hypothetical protein